MSDERSIENRRRIRTGLEQLREEHLRLDAEIATLEAAAYCDQLTLRRLKKRKLYLRDEIEQMKSALIPDLNA